MWSYVHCFFIQFKWDAFAGILCFWKTFIRNHKLSLGKKKKEKIVKTDARSNLGRRKEAAAPWKLLCILLFTHTSDILPGMLSVEGVQVVVKGKERERCYAETTDTLWRPSQVPRAALHLNGGQKMMPAVRRGFDVLRFASGGEQKWELWWFFLCGRKQTINKTIRECPQHEWGHLMMELSLRGSAPLWAEQRLRACMPTAQPSAASFSRVGNFAPLSSCIFTSSYKLYRYKRRQWP